MYDVLHLFKYFNEMTQNNNLTIVKYISKVMFLLILFCGNWLKKEVKLHVRSVWGHDVKIEATSKWDQEKLSVSFLREICNTLLIFRN